MVPGTTQPEDGVNRRHPRGEHVGAFAAFEFRHGAFERLAVRVIGAPVVVAFVFAQLLLHVCRSLLDGRDNRSGGWIRLLPDAYRLSGKSHVPPPVPISLPPAAT